MLAERIMPFKIKKRKEWTKTFCMLKMCILAQRLLAILRVFRL